MIDQLFIAYDLKLWLRSTWRYECLEAFDWPIRR